MAFKQDGPCLELLSAQGRTDLSMWRQSLPGNVKKVFDSSSKTFVFLLSGSPSTAVRLTTPPEPNQFLNLPHQVLVLQLRIPETKDFSFECVVSDDALSRRRLQFSTFFREIQISPESGKFPLTAVRRGKWCSICVPLWSLVRSAWPGRVYDQLDGLTVCANCSLLKVILLKNQDNGPISIPQSFQLRSDLNSITQVLTWSVLSQVSKKPRSPDIGLRKRLQRSQRDADFHLAAEGVGLFQVQPILRPSRGSNRQTVSAPTAIPRIRQQRASERDFLSAILRSFM